MTLKYEKGMMYKKGMILLLEKGKIKLIEGYMHNNFQNEFIYNCIYIDKDQKKRPSSSEMENMFVVESISHADEKLVFGPYHSADIESIPFPILSIIPVRKWLESQNIL